MLMATHSGLRGRPGEELSGEVVERTVGGLIALMRSRKLSEVVAVARDERPTSASLTSEVARIALALGSDVIDFGVLSTPGTKLAASSRGVGGAVVVTGSHLEPDVNGLKLVAGPSYGPVDIRELPEPDMPVAGRPGRLMRDESAVEQHVTAIRDFVDVEAVRGAGLRVDCRGGAGPAARLLLEELGCCSGPGDADLGLTLDADGDRLELVDERGESVDAEFTLPLVALACDAATIVKGADTSRMVDAIAASRGGGVRIVPPGEIHLFDELSKRGGDLAGEGNGGVVVPEVGLARDGLAAAAAIIALVARSGEPLSAHTAQLPPYVRRRSTVPRADFADGPAALEAVARRTGAQLTNPEVGVSVEADEGRWGLVRMSATEPVIRVTVEAPTEAEADSLHDELRAALADGRGS